MKCIRRQAYSIQMASRSLEEPTIIHTGEKIIAANDAVCSLVGADSSTQLVGQPLFEYLNAGNQESLMGQFERVRDNGETLGVHAELTTRQGLKRDVIALSSPVEWENQPELQTTLLTLDGDESLSETVLRDRAMHESPIGITIADATREDIPLIYVNDTFVALTGYSRAEVLGRNCRFLQGPETREEPVAKMREAIEAGESVTVELRNYRKDGSMFWNRVTLTPITDESGDVTHYLGFQQDVCDRKAREREKTLFEKQAEATEDAIVITDRDGTIEYVNPAFERMTGYTAEEALGKTPRILKSGEHDEPFYDELWETITVGDVWERQITNRTKTGELYQVKQTIVPITDDRGEVTHFAAVETDVTTEQLTSQMMNVMHRALRHNIRTSVQVIDSYAELIQADTTNADHHASLQTIRNHAKSLQELSEQLTTIQRVLDKDQTTTQPVEVVVDSCMKRFQTTFPDANLTLEMAVDAPHLIENGSVLQLALAEAVENAVAHSDQKTPTVEITVQSQGDTQHVTIEIADDGPGIPEDEWDIITSGEETPLVHSSGIGLWLLYWAITALGGTVSYSQNDPQGAVVTFEVPTKGKPD